MENENYSKAIEKSCIPGIDVNEDLHLQSLIDIDYHMKYYEDSYGCYVCNCGYYYGIGPCGFPDPKSKFNCIRCGKPIGYAPRKYKDDGRPELGMVIREGHLRIFKNAEQKDSQMGRFNVSDKNFPNMLYDDYLKKIIEPIRKKCSFGFNAISRDFFESQEKKNKKFIRSWL